MNRGRKTLVAMSGGVDSSVAACLLKEQGHDVIGVFMRLGSAGHTGTEDADQAPSHLPSAAGDPLSSGPRTQAQHVGCCSAGDASDARAVAGRLGIPFYVLNFEEDFDRLIDYFVDEYAAARTPNPCVRCNEWLKFGKLVAYADAVQADFIATGHYARVLNEGGRPRLLRARYPAKDQSYVLFGIEPAVLRRTIFPLGELTKDEVRAHARRLGLSLHDKPESQDICFVPDGNYARLIEARRPEALRPGLIRHVDGRVLGEHTGLAHFTIGQRRGLRVALGSPVYVTDLDPETNTVTIGPREALLSRVVTAADVSWFGDAPATPIRGDVKIRYLHRAAPATVSPLPGGGVRVEFDDPQPAVTPGQALVVYLGDEVLGGGWIERRK